MDGYPNSDEEFELMYGDEFELMRSQEDEYISTPGPKSKKSLNFDSPNQRTKSDYQKPSKSKQNSDFQTPSSSKIITDFQTQSTSKQSCSTTALDSSFDKDFVAIDIDQTQSKKRGIEDLFGDIDDILLEDKLHKIKKTKKDGDDEQLINFIVQSRQLHKDKQHTMTLSEIQNTFRVGSHKNHIRENLSFRVPRFPFIVVVRHDGERVYVRMHSEEYEKEDIDRVVKENTGDGLLMGSAFQELMRKAKEHIKKQNEEKRKRKEEVEEVTTNIDNTELWVDRYRPRKYLELLSDESTNRMLLRWVKLWDKIVFNRRPKISIKKNKKENEWFKKKEMDVTLDEHDRPLYKIALLCGPPGLGKTTLAHLVCRHAGYFVVEVNASDDRSIDKFREALRSIEMKNFANGRPNCLVLDEIDGAPASSIDFLVKFVNGTVKGKRGKKKTPNITQRPIICICNDVYVPALRPLRQMAFVLNFPPTASTRLAERLCEIARHQKINTDIGAMTALSEKSENDIRSCLSVLQFFKSQNKSVTLSEIHRHSVGNKDMNKGLFTVWEELFRLPRPIVDLKKKKKDAITEELENEAFRTESILHTVQSFGDYDRLAQGIYENFPLITSHDLAVDVISEGLDWFCFMDLLSQRIQETQNYTMSTYIPYAFVKWNNLFSVTTKPKITYPTLSSEIHIKSTKSTAQIADIMKGTLPSIRPFVTRNILRLEILPFVAEIIVPVLRSGNITLFGNCEKQQMNTIVNIMIDYNLTYTQERTVDGNYVFNLDPNIEDICQFAGLKKQRRTLQYSVKQLIAREIELGNVRRLETRTQVVPVEKKKEVNEEQKKDDKENTDVNIVPVLPNHLQRLKPKDVAAKIKETVSRDFFGRITSKPSKSIFGVNASSEVIQDVRYVYKEGYNNAVKRRLTIKQLK